MANPPSLLDELRTQYEAARQTTHEHSDVEGFQVIDARLRKAFRWLEKAITYLDGLKPAIDHRFDLGHGLVFESPRFAHGSVGQHERRITGFPVLDEINLYYEITAAKPLALDVAPGGAALAEKALDDAGLQYTSRRVEDAGGHAAQMFDFGAAGHSGCGRVSCRLSNRIGVDDTGQRRPSRTRDARIPQQCDRGARPRRPRAPYPRPRLRVPAPRAACGTPRPAAPPVEVSPPMDRLATLFAEYGLPFVFGAVFLEQLGPPIPSGPLLIVAGALAVEGQVSALLVAGVAWLACMLGKVALYVVGCRYGRQTLDTLCRWSMSPGSCIDKADDKFDRWGPQVLLLAEFIPGIRTLAPTLAGAKKLRPMTFLVYSALGSALWAGSISASASCFRSRSSGC